MTKELCIIVGKLNKSISLKKCAEVKLDIVFTGSECKLGFSVCHGLFQSILVETRQKSHLT